MAWTAPESYTLDQVVGVTEMHKIRDNMRELFHRVARVEFTDTKTATPGTHIETAPLDIVSAGAITYGGFPIIVKVVAPFHTLISSASVFAGVSLWDDTTDLGRLATLQTTSQTSSGPFYAETALTPTAASHTYKARIWAASATTGVIGGGAGGVGVSRPGFIEIWEKGGS